MAELYRELEKYRDSDYYPFHMPGHKRNKQAAGGALAESYGLDITEIDGFDNLHQAQGILREEQEKAAKLYGAKQSYYLVNGSTCGIISAVFAVTKKGDKILMARNCHKAAYHAVYLRELKAVYLQPEILAKEDVGDFGIAGGIRPETVEQALQENPDCVAVLITSPTYEGVVSNIKKIADIAHFHGIPLIVDEAHGAHFGFHEAYPVSSVRLGADLVIHSVHKTLPAMTQTALLHWNDNSEPNGKEWQADESKEKLVDRKRLERYLRIFQTSSPSYVLMASMSHCMEMVRKEGRELLDRLIAYRCMFMKRIKDCRYIKTLWGQEESGSSVILYDSCKLVISIAGDRMTGQELYDVLLERYHLQMEMAAANYVLAIVTMMDTKEGWNRLADALIQIDAKLQKHCQEEKRMADTKQKEGQKLRCNSSGRQMPPEAVMSIAEAYDAQQEKIRLTDSRGRISAEFINLYPPGIPLVVPGEKMTDEIVEMLIYYDRIRLPVQGMENGWIRVVNKEKNKRTQRKEL